MQVRFLKHKIDADKEWNLFSGIPKDEVLSMDKVFTVFGISIHNNIINYEILFDVDTYTKTFPSHFFEVIDNRLSRFFCFGKSLTGDNEEIVFISFKEWVGIENRFFYYKLVEGESTEVKLFEYYKERMNLEFRDFSIDTAAIHKEGVVLECPKCENIWLEQLSDFEMCRCSKCKSVLINPLFDKK